MEERIEGYFVGLLGGGDEVAGSGTEGVGERKGMGRGRIVLCSEVERLLFGSGALSKSTTNELASKEEEKEEEREETASDSSSEQHRDEQADTPDGDGGVLLPTNPPSLKNAQQNDARTTGHHRALHREKVRQAARRGVAFGFLVPCSPSPGESAGEAISGHGNGDGDGESDRKREKRKVEAVQAGRVVESSFAKGEWGVRWVG